MILLLVSGVQLNNDKGPYSQSYALSSDHVWTWELDHKEGWALKNWCFQIAVVEKIFKSPLDSKEIKPVNPKGNQPWYSLEGLILKLQYFGHLMWRASSLEETLRVRKIEGRRRREWQRWDGWMASWIQWTWTWAPPDSSLPVGGGKPRRSDGI